MLDSKSSDTLLLMVTMSSTYEHMLIPDLSLLTQQLICGAVWASMNVGSTDLIAWNDSRHVPSWRFHLHCGIEDTASPSIISIIGHQVFRHSLEHGTSSMGKHILANAYIPKLNELTESEVTELTYSMLDEIALAILKRPGSRDITIVCSHRRFIFNIEVLSIIDESTDKSLQTGNYGSCHISISPSHQELVPQVRTCFLLTFIKTL